MDDVLASQQLVEEGARAEHATSDNRGRSSTPVDDIANSSEEEHPIDLTTQPGPTASQQSLPSSPPSIFINNRQSLTHASEDAPASPLIADEVASQPRNKVEVPDSQLVPPPGSLPLTPVATSSFAVPGTMQHYQIQKNSRKTARKLRSEVDTLNAVLNHGTPSNDKENTLADAANISPASAPQTKRKRKKSYVTPPSTATGSERAMAASDAETSAMLLFDDVVPGAEAATTSIKRTNKKQRGQLIKSLTSSVPTGSTADDTATAHDETTTGRLKRVEGKLRRIKKSKPLIFTNSSNDGQDDASKVVQTPQTSKKRKDKKRVTSVGVLDWDASARAGDQPMADAMQQDPLLDEDIPDDAPSKHTTPKPKTERRFKSASQNTPARRYTRKSNVDTTILAADRELNTSRILNHPPVLPDGGKFTQDEDEILRRAILDYQQRHNFSTMDLVAVVQWTDPRLDHANPRKRSGLNPEELEAEAESKEFWKEILHSEPQLKRKGEIVKRHVQARYHAFKSGGWTEEEDEQLESLMKEYPSQWKMISLFMSDRSAIDIQNRWKDYVQHGDRRNTSRWTVGEESSLLKALTTVLQRDEDRRDAEGLPSIAEYTNKDINWSAVCELMGNVRSRLQCTVKWTQLKERDPTANVRPVYKRGRTPDPNQRVEPTPKKVKKPRKSEAQVASGDEEGETISQKKRRTSRKSEAQLDSDGGDNATVVSKKRRRKSRAKQAEPQDQEDATLNGIDDEEEPLVTEVPRTRRRSRKSSRKSAEDVLEEDPVAPEEGEIQAEGQITEDIATLGEDDDHEQGPPEDVATPREDSEQDITTQAQHDGQETTTPEDGNDHTETITEKHNEAESTQHEEVSATLEIRDSSVLGTPQQPQSSTQVRTGIAQMTWDDKFDLISTIAKCSLKPDDRLDWAKFADYMQNQWSGKDLRRVYKELLLLVPKQGTRAERITVLIEHLGSYVDEDKLKAHYDSLKAGETGPSENGDLTTAKPLGETEMSTEAGKPMSKKKRKRDVYDTPSASRSDGKKRKKSSTLTRPGAVMSAPLSTASDNVERVQES
jgi:hypothetical protein